MTPRVFSDERGHFFENFRHDLLAEHTGMRFVPRQANTSVSSRGVLRGIHFADVPLGQAKYVSVARGAIVDFVVDIRAGSPTFGQWDSVVLDSVDRRSLFIPEGIGHAFVALEDDTAVTYLVSDVYRPGKEHGIHPLDPAIGLTLPVPPDQLIISSKDADAPTLDQAADSGLLPTWEACLERYAQLERTVD